MDAYIYIFGCLLSYLLGSIPFGFLIGKYRGVDVRQRGSGNIGATNVLRTVGKRWGALVLFLDLLKGFISAWFIPIVMAAIYNTSPPYLIGLACGSAAIAGHNYPVYLKFKGGKGIATTTGMLAGIAPAAFICGILTWLILFLSTRYVSVASIGAAVGVTLSAWILKSQGNSVPIALSIIAAVIILRHRSNIKRLINGTENRLTFKKKKSERND